MKLNDLYRQWFDSEFPYCYIIGEIGINHNGDLELAKSLISVAKEAGCDAVKFQKRDPEVAVPVEIRNIPRETPWGTMSYLDYKKRIEFGLEEYREIESFCRDIEIDWSASAWDIGSQHFLRNFNTSFNKVASAMITNLEFLEEVAKEKRITFVSTGMCTMSDIESAVEIFNRFDCPIVLFHTVSTYPAALEDLNLLMIRTLKNKFPDVPIGYSGHESNVFPTVHAVSLGAVAIERHITTDRTMYGTDQAASLEFRGLSKLVTEVRRIPTLMGNGEKTFSEKEKAVARKLRPINSGA